MRSLTCAVVMAVVTALLVPEAFAQGTSTGSSGFHGELWNPVKLAATPSPGSHQLKAPATVKAPNAKALTPYQASKPSWAAAGSATVALATSSATASAKPVRAGSLPVWIARAAKTKSGHAATAASSVRVQLASHDHAVRFGANGMLLGVTRADGKSTADHVKVVIDYSSLTKAYGGGYGARLQVQQVPACALTTPQVAACQKRTPITFTNRAGSAELTADVGGGGGPPGPAGAHRGRRQG
ncbi:hypothetical protein AB0399_39015 [Streptomyces sp. NPDC088194]|uniref:hypothetical protein n=1 Tax=Streptomyces sp. NPDC088194 TaxID=3154931 RepID=UPI00344DD45B